MKGDIIFVEKDTTTDVDVYGKGELYFTKSIKLRNGIYSIGTIKKFKNHYHFYFGGFFSDRVFLSYDEMLKITKKLLELNNEKYR